MGGVVVKSLYGDIVLRGTHPEEACAGRHCVVHNPVRPNDQRRLTWRGDRGFFEEVCPCGIGHPTPEDVEYWNALGLHSLWFHGCCLAHCYSAGYRDEVVW